MTRNDPCLTDATKTMDRLLAAVPASQRGSVRMLLTNPRRGGRGLRALVSLFGADPHTLPDTLPAELVDVFLRDDEAEPLYDCERCGLPVPVRAGRRCGHEASVDREYFPQCPRCGGRTGRHAFWSAPSRS